MTKEITISIALTITIFFHFCTTMIPGQGDCPPPRKNADRRDQQTDNMDGPIRCSSLMLE
jgi:hypothetical protein